MLQTRCSRYRSVLCPAQAAAERRSPRTGALAPCRHTHRCIAALQQWQPDVKAYHAHSGDGRSRRRNTIARAATPEPVVAVDGDLVTLHYDCTDMEGEMVDSSRARDEPVSMELGVSEIVSNPLLSAMEQAVRSHGVGDIIQLSLQGKDYDPELVFKVPCDHPEIIRLQGRYKSQGGLVEDKVVELQNSSWAKVLKVSESEVILDANPMLAGVQRRLTIEILGIERPAVPASEG